MATNPTNEEPATPELTTTTSTDPTDSEPDRRLTLFIVDTDPSFEMQAGPDCRSIMVTHLPVRANESGYVTILKDGMWQPKGECSNCGDIGPGYYPCTRCEPDRFLYVIVDREADGVVIHPRKLGAVATLVHSILRQEPDPVAARAQFRQLLDSMFILDNVGQFSDTVLDMIMSQEPHVVVSDPHKLNIVASQVHSTIRDEPDPTAGFAHFNLLLDCFLSANDPNPFDDE